MNEEGDITEQNVRIWRLKKLLKSLEAAKGNGTSMISLIIPPKDQISRVSKMLADEYGTATNIKSRVNRQSVLSAITSTQQRLKLYQKVPPNGLVIYCGTVLTDDRGEKLINIDFEPFKPINTSLYLCDNKFHIEPLSAMLESDLKFGFIIMDGSGTLFGEVSGNTRSILHKLSVELPKKHGRGGQSAARFGRLRMEKRHNYIRKIAELTAQIFISNNHVTVSGLILAGSADFKTELKDSNLLDQRLAEKIIKLVDVSYGGENGFNQAIELSQEVLQDVKFVKEKTLLQQYYAEISSNTGKFCYGIDHTMHALEAGAVDTLIVWENLAYMRVRQVSSVTGEKIIYIKENIHGVQDNLYMIDPATNMEYETLEKVSLLEWLADNYKDFGSKLAFVTDKSQEGTQFVKGFSGIGAILRYPINLDVADAMVNDDFNAFLDDEFDY